MLPERIVFEISTHALREEGDALPRFAPKVCKGISTHALREEGDIVTVPGWDDIMTFLPTPSARRATRWPQMGRPRWLDFYPRPPRGGRRRSRPFFRARRQISTHALREEGDDTLAFAYARVKLFLPTPSARRATRSSAQG